jgi:hypothetical protein
MSAPVEKAGDKIHCLKCGQRLQIPPAERAKTVLAPSLGIDGDGESTLPDAGNSSPPHAGNVAVSGQESLLPSITGSQQAPTGNGKAPAHSAPAFETPEGQAAGENILLSRARAILSWVLASEWRRLPTSTILWPCFFLFFLPWVNISCVSVDGKTMHVASQSGFQTCYGGSTLDQKFERLAVAEGGRPGQGKLEKKDDKTPWSFLSVLYGLLITIGGIVGLICIVVVFMKLSSVVCGAAHLLSLGLGGLAFLALGLQMFIHFPIERDFDRKLAEEGDKKSRRQNLDKEIQTLDQELFQLRIRRPPFGEDNVLSQQIELKEAAINQKRTARDQLGRDEIGEMAALIEFKYTIWLWLTMLIGFLSVPVFLFESAILIYQHRVKLMPWRFAAKVDNSPASQDSFQTQPH